MMRSSTTSICPAWCLARFTKLSKQHLSDGRTACNASRKMMRYSTPLRWRGTMAQLLRVFRRSVLLAFFAWLPVHAQDVQFLPEIDAHLKLDSTLRVYLQAKDDREGGDPA